jgi:hypothetical protein
MSEFEKKCFVLMPFREQYKEIYTEVYVPVCHDNRIICWRVDEIARPGSITRDIIEGILDADIVIADLTSKNANVFYELGIAHATSNKTIMTSQTLEDIPFDIANYRVIIYEHTITGCKELYRKLDQAIKELLAALDRTNNPFQEVLSSRVSFRVKDKVPLAKFVDFSLLRPRVRSFLQKNNIVYLSDLTAENLEALAATEGIGRDSLSALCSQLMQSEQCEDLDILHDFLLKHGINATPKRSY